MADLMPQNFATPISSAIASYPYSDIKEGTGYVHYMVVRAQVDATSGNDIFPLITDSSINSVEVGGEPKTVLAASKEFNFDVLFNTPKIVNGTIIAVLSCEIANTTTPKIRVLQWDGSTETELVAQITYQDLAATAQYAYAYKIAISNKIIPAGQSLRFEVIFASGVNSYLLHDPTASETANPSGGRTSFYVPFKLLD